ncbi:MAG: nucleotidyl transferase AbiEii/AbiGii toxin family protein [Candidatus Pacearchaeota archaeon]
MASICQFIYDYCESSQHRKIYKSTKVIDIYNLGSLNKMAHIPLILRLKKESHRKVAEAQDIIVKEIYRFFNNAVFHGGSAIWRCYSGNRFSEDVDFYLTKDLDKINLFFISLEKKGFIIERKKLSENSIFSTLLFERSIVRFEAVFKKVKGILKEYELSDGNFINVYTLSPEHLIKEKIGAYINRRKIRDIYDVFFLIRYIADINVIKKDLKKLINDFVEPIDKSDLNTIILEGIVPNVNDMLTYIKRYAQNGKEKIY